MTLTERIGEKYITYQGYEVEIIEYFKEKNCTIILKDGTVLKNRKYDDIKNGKIKNPFHPTIHGIGYYGLGKYTANYKSYEVWRGILNRAYNQKYSEKINTYKDVTVCEEWHNFQNFAKWFEENYKPHMEGWHLDKDILVRGNKTYSPETCCFVPQEINILFTKSSKVRGNLYIGVTYNSYNYVASININKKKTYLGCYNTPEEAFQAYKIAKEIEIKRVATLWKDLIDPQVYQAMCNYKVEITD